MNFLKAFCQGRMLIHKTPKARKCFIFSITTLVALLPIFRKSLKVMLDLLLGLLWAVIQVNILSLCA